MIDTELRVFNWRYGQPRAEGLAAALLSLSGYEQIDPQAPIGGPDGRKDILCAKGGVRWVGAAYFPPTSATPNAVRKKFQRDLEGAKAHNCGGFVFLTNQRIKLKQRENLKKIAEDHGLESELFHLDRITTLLNSPSGYGVRIEFLQIAMSLEEQLSWFAQARLQLDAALGANTRGLRELKTAIEGLTNKQAHVMRTLRAMAGEDFAAPLQTPELLTSTNFSAELGSDFLTDKLDESVVLLFHRLICFDLPARIVGKLRSSKVKVGRPENLGSYSFEPPAAELVRGQLDQLCRDWRSNFHGLRFLNDKNRLIAVAQFHARFLRIHPFDDGNGRVARAILMQQCLDFFGRADMSLLQKGVEYYEALKDADKEFFEPLAQVIKPVVGIEVRESGDAKRN